MLGPESKFAETTWTEFWDDAEVRADKIKVKTWTLLFAADPWQCSGDHHSSEAGVGTESVYVSEAFKGFFSATALGLVSVPA